MVARVCCPRSVNGHQVFGCESDGFRKSFIVCALRFLFKNMLMLCKIC